MTFQMMRSGFVAKLVTGAVAILLTTTFAACGAQGSASSVTSSDTSSVAQETANADATSKKAEKKDEKKEVNPTSIGDMSSDAIKAQEPNRPNDDGEKTEGTDTNDGAANVSANEPTGEVYVEDRSDYYEEPSYTNNYQPQYDYSYSEPVADYSYSAPEPQAPAPQQESAPQQNTDACLGDVVLRN